jgi:hypothetical protein
VEVHENYAYLYHNKKDSSPIIGKYLPLEVSPRIWTRSNLHVRDGTTQISSTISLSGNNKYDACDQVNYECGSENKPQLEKSGDKRARGLGYFIGYGMVDEREERGKVVATMFANMFSSFSESALSRLELLLAPF